MHNIFCFFHSYWKHVVKSLLEVWNNSEVVPILSTMMGASNFPFIFVFLFFFSLSNQHRWNFLHPWTKAINFLRPKVCFGIPNIFNLCICSIYGWCIFCFLSLFFLKNFVLLINRTPTQSFLQIINLLYSNVRLYFIFKQRNDFSRHEDGE